MHHGVVSVTIDISGIPHERIVSVPSPLAELGMALHALSEPGHHPGLQGWATATSAALDPCLADRLLEADFLWRVTFSDVFMPFAGLPGATAGRLPGPTVLPGATLTEELDLMDRLTDQQFVDVALEFSCDLSYGKRSRDVLGEPELRQRSLELAAARGPHQLAFTHRLLEDPPGVRAWLRRLFEECDEAFFADTWNRLRHQLAADTRHKNDLLRHKGLGESLPEVSRALSLDEDGRHIRVDKLSEGRTVADARGVTLIPTSLGRPHLMVLHRWKWQPVIVYPVGSSPQLTSPSSVDLLTRRMEALAHPVRIRLCRHLARGDYTTGELAKAHGMTAPEISRHLSALKKAGLLTTRRRGRYVMHQLDLSVVARLGSDFIEGVLR